MPVPTHGAWCPVPDKKRRAFALRYISENGHIPGQILLHSLSCSHSMVEIIHATGLGLEPGMGDGSTGTSRSAMAEFIKGMGTVLGIGIGIIVAIQQ